MRFKKQIIIICLFTFLFNGMFFKEKEVKADVLALPITIGVKEVVTALLLSAGITITDKYTHNALVQEVYKEQTERVNNIVAEVEAGNRFSLVKEGEKILETIKKVYDLTYDDSVSANSYMFYENKTLEPKVNYNIGVLGGSYTFSFNTPTLVRFRNSSGGNHTSITCKGSSGVIEILSSISGNLRSLSFTLDGVQFGSSTLMKTVKDMYLYVDNAVAVKGYFTKKPTWEKYKEANKDVAINTSALANSSICADDVINWDDTWELDDSQSYPLDKEYGSIVLTPDDVLEKPSVDDMETPTTGDSLWDTLFGFLKTLFSPITKLLSSLWDLIKKLFDMLKGLLSSILDLLKTLVKSLVDAIAGLFVPTVAFEDIFKDTQKNFIGQIVNFFDFSTLWNIEPKPLEFKIKMPFYDFAKGERVPYEFDIKFFENKFMKENINLIRNVITYPILITTVYFIILHFMPKRDVD